MARDADGDARGRLSFEPLLVCHGCTSRHSRFADSREATESEQQIAVRDDIHRVHTVKPALLESVAAIRSILAHAVASRLRTL